MHISRSFKAILLFKRSLDAAYANRAALAMVPAAAEADRGMGRSVPY